MPTIKKGTIEYEVNKAPDSPLNLRMGVIYGPRKQDEFGGGLNGYSCVEVGPGEFIIAGWGAGRTSVLWEGNDLRRAYVELATLLGMRK